MLETELRNPFGLRDNRIILIKDIPVNQNGLKCNCVCPACKEPFIAKWAMFWFIILLIVVKGVMLHGHT